LKSADQTSHATEFRPALILIPFFQGLLSALGVLGGRFDRALTQKLDRTVNFSLGLVIPGIA